MTKWVKHMSLFLINIGSGIWLIYETKVHNLPGRFGKYLLFVCTKEVWCHVLFNRRKDLKDFTIAIFTRDPCVKNKLNSHL